MYALRHFAGRFCVAGADLLLCKGSDVRPGAPWSLPLCRWLLRGGRGTWCCARGRMYVLASLGLRGLLRGRRGAWCSARGRMYGVASLGLRHFAGRFCVAGAALAALQGVGCTPWHPLVSAAFCVGRRSTCCSARGRMYALASLGLRCFCVAGAALGALQGVGCTPWRPLVSAALPVAFAWQAQTCCSARGRMYALASLGLRRSAGSFCVASAALAALQGVGCTPWRPLVSAALPVGFAWQAQHLVLRKGSDVRTGVLALLRSCSSEAGHGDVSTQLIQIDCLSAYHGFFIHALSAHVMMLVYGTWTTHSHSRPPSHSLTPGLPRTLSLHSLHSLHSLTHSLAPLLARSLTRSLSLAHSPSHHSHTHTTLTSLTHRLTHPPVHAHTHTHTQTHPP